MYSIPRGTDECDQLITPRLGDSAPTSSLYQNDDELFVNYGSTTDSSQQRNFKMEHSRFI